MVKHWERLASLTINIIFWKENVESHPALIACRPVLDCLKTATKCLLIAEDFDLGCFRHIILVYLKDASQTVTTFECVD